ncbi:FecR family protein [Spirosoma rhododendri]|uniref:DUF4974 domain-containing protein n=1 Tax=Spirosoma rhododendri TaxID=2728024 RepID=A0A7L5DSD2_9BACT|nr:FecR family protein [Spirosoma rhododendri]QJD80522.1 DUF4974 domain-containing protein [Spirosoma rhododendri]
MSQYEFDELLQKYLAGACTPAEEKLILDWYSEIDSEGAAPLNKAEKRAIQQRIWQRLAAKTSHFPASRQPVRYAWAAVVAAGLVGIGLFIYWSGRPVAAETAMAESGSVANTIVTVNRISRSQAIRLDDGTVVVLKPEARLTYPAHFGRTRRAVTLSGEAFFRVRRNPVSPFMVQTGDLITEVLGTTFTIKSSADTRNVEVAVLTGRVSVYPVADQAQRGRHEVVLKPNERVTYRSDSHQLVPTLVDQPVLVGPVRELPDLTFDKAPLPAVMDRLQALYGIDIVLENDALSTCSINADLNDLSLYNQLDLVCRSVDASYEVRGTSIFIRGNGCP